MNTVHNEAAKPILDFYEWKSSAIGMRYGSCHFTPEIPSAHLEGMIFCLFNEHKALRAEIDALRSMLSKFDKNAIPVGSPEGETL